MKKNFCKCGKEKKHTSKQCRKCYVTKGNQKGKASITSPYRDTYKSWHSMIERCTKPQRARYKDWGGRGIKVCKDWFSFDNFLKDMGIKPKGLSLDRIDNDGNYEPDNCRWASVKTQNKNKRKVYSNNKKMQN